MSAALQAPTSAAHLVRGRARERAPTLAEDLQQKLEDLIVGGTLAPGARLDEAELVERYQVSRTPVREALRALAGNGLVEMRGVRGACVARISMPVLIEMFQVMSAMEGLCARHAARRATNVQREQMERLHGELERSLGAADHERFYAINHEFHDALYEASNTVYIAEQTRMLRRRVGVYRRLVTFQPGRMAATIGEHAAIVDAIRRRDPEAAFDAASGHVELLQDEMVDLIAALSRQLPAD